MTATAAEEAAAMVAAVRDDPAGRRALASRFYDRCIGRKSLRSYRRAEMAFMRWQIRRGVLAAPDADPPGSRWWRAVNERLLLDACEADRLFRGGLGAPTRASVASPLSFLHRPSGASWYRAHNASIVGGYVAYRHLAHEEHPLERFFMDVALVRVLFAECLLSAPRVALGRFGAAGRLLADPRWRGADFFLSLHNILPVRYPLDGLTVRQDPRRRELRRAPHRLRRHPSSRDCRLRPRGVRPGGAATRRDAPRRRAGVCVAVRGTPGLDGDESTRRDQGRPAADRLI
jgi:hypothetical protein